MRRGVEIVEPSGLLAELLGVEASAPSQANEDARLLERLRRCDDDAFEGLVRSQSPRMLATARRLLRSDDDAQDAVQDAFVSAFRSIGSFRGGARLSTWLHRIVVNAA